MRESRTVAKVLADVLCLLSVAALGIFAGAMLTEAGVLVPYWRSLSPAEFLAWYAANDERLLGFFGPLTSVAAVLALLAALIAVWARRPGRWLALLSTALSFAAVAMYALYFQEANASFSDASIDPGQLPAELARWATWHWVRTAISCAALAAALLSLVRGWGVGRGVGRVA
jgi:uncharacterized membrane protein